MIQVLLITVGGSPQPLITAIQSLQPQRIIFICSKGENGSMTQITGQGTPCEIRQGGKVVQRLPNIPTYLQLGKRFDATTDLIGLDNPDDLSQVYHRIYQPMCQLLQEFPPDALGADYTGGTKTMSLALGLAALDCGIRLYLTTSAQRNNLEGVNWGEATEGVFTADLVWQRTLQQHLTRLLDGYHYATATSQLEQLLRWQELPANSRPSIRELRDYGKGLQAWDKFDHLSAWQFLKVILSPQSQLYQFLERVMASRARVDSHFNLPMEVKGDAGHGYELVQDLQLNAQRRASQERYDEAVGRLYRAVELLAQIRLRQAYGVLTSDLDLTQLPLAMGPEYAGRRSPRTGKIQLGVCQSYELLARYPEDPLGQLYQQHRLAILDAIEIRHNSFLAHGFSVISRFDFDRVEAALGAFLSQAMEAIAPNSPPPVPFPKILSSEQPSAPADPGDLTLETLRRIIESITKVKSFGPG